MAFWYLTRVENQGREDEPIKLIQFTLQNEPSSRPLRADRLEICRDFLRSTCTRNDLLKEGRSHEKLAGTLCKYAHPERVSFFKYRDNID